MDGPASSAPPPKRSIWRNWISLAGSVIALGSFFSFLFLFAFDSLAGASNPYVGILSYVVAPIFLIIGLTLLLLGAWLRRRQLRRGDPAAPPPQLAIDLENPRDRKRLIYFSLGTITFLLFSALGSVQTYHLTETVEFCGQVCHQVMKPEFTAYQNGEHARVSCVECHVGSGASYFLKSKINGAHQLWGVISGNYKTPIPTPVSNLRPAQDTCEKCHWPQRFSGNLERTYNHFLADSDNKPHTVRLLLHVGGGDDRHGHVGGIHWHTSKDNRVEYFAEDEQRLKIPWVRVSKPDGTATVFRTPDFDGEPDPAKIRTMDCLDCHNRPAHRFLSPNDAVDKAIYLGRIDPKLPQAKRRIVDILSEAYATDAEAAAGISASIRKAFGESPAAVQAAAATQAIYDANFFPFMKADWSKYPEHIGHKDWPGCFRCHDDEHEAVGKPGKKMAASDCNTCHTILAQGSGVELSILAPEGQPFKHPDALPEGLTCADCHNGKNQSP